MELSPALTAASQSSGNYVCATIPYPQGGGTGCYDSGLYNLPCIPYYAGGSCFPTHAMCASVCPHTIVNPGGNKGLSKKKLDEELQKNIANKLLNENPKPMDVEELPPAFAGGASAPSGNDCVVYNGDIWLDRFYDVQTNTFQTVPDCYPNIASRVGKGCPAQPGQCFFWAAPTIPVCVVDRLLNYSAAYFGIRDGFICETCNTPTCPGGPGCSPNGIAVQGNYSPVIPYPQIISTNVTGAFCTDCTVGATNEWWFCLHNTDPHWTAVVSCIQLSANTIVNVVYNPFPGPIPTTEYYATNGPTTYQLSSNIYHNTSTVCELNCNGGCKILVSGGTVACNYDLNAQYDDGSCCFSTPCVGCGDPVATNYEPNSCSFNNLLCLYPGEGCTDNTVGSYTDINGNATCGPSANQLCENCNYDPLATIPKPCCDIVGCMNNLPGSNPDVNGMYTCGPLGNSGCLAFNYDPNACCPGYCCNQGGCTDPTASNYDPNACIDDGSCEWVYYGCTDNTACNYDPTATVPCNLGSTGPGSNDCCVLPGCLDSFGSNYSPTATHDCSCTPGGTDYSCCIYVQGCLDPTAYNYSSTAAGCDNGNGILVPTNFSCCLYPTWGCNPNLDIEGPGGSGTDIWEYCTLQDNQNGYATEEECWCECGDTYSVACCNRPIDPTLVPIVGASTADCCVEYFNWDSNLQAFRMKGRNDYCHTGDMRYRFMKKAGGPNNPYCQGFATTPIPFDVGPINGRGIKYGEEVIISPTQMFGNSDPVGAYTFMVTCQNMDYTNGPISYSQICIDYIPNTQTLVQSYSINNNGYPGWGFGTPNTACLCNIPPCDSYNSNMCGHPACELPGSVPNYPGMDIDCCISAFGLATLMAGPFPATIINTIGYVGDMVGTRICNNTEGYWQIWRKVGVNGTPTFFAASGPSISSGALAVTHNIVSPGTYIELTLYLECEHANCYQAFHSTPNLAPPVGACRQQKLCLERVDNGQFWRIVSCKGGIIIWPDEPIGAG